MHTTVMAVDFIKIWQRLLSASAVFLWSACAALAHPHVFVDGGVSFRFRDSAVLEALLVTWRYDAFETLYILSSHGLSLNEAGGLDEEDRLALVEFRSNWPEDFDGSAHMSVNGDPIALDWPTGLDAHLVDGRLEVTFERRLTRPVDLSGQVAEIGFYESTYFFAFSITDPPKLTGLTSACVTEVIAFDPDAEDVALQETLAKLDREETPEIQDVGALFADRIVLTCGS